MLKTYRTKNGGAAGLPIDWTMIPFGHMIRQDGKLMKRRTAFPSQEFVWTKLAPRIEAYLTEQKLTLLELMGLYRLFGSPGDGFTGQLEGNEAIKELTGQIVCLFL